MFVAPMETNFDDDGARFVWPREHTEDNIIEMVSYVLTRYSQFSSVNGWAAQILRDMPAYREGRYMGWQPKIGT